MLCILHIGTEKTATTLLQKWLYENEENLSSQGVALTQKCGVTNNRKLVSYFQTSLDDYLKKESVFTKSDRKGFFEPFHRELSSEISEKSNRHESFIFTSEHFHSRLHSEKEIENLKLFLDKFFTDYKVICYFREQSRVRTSLYSTGLKRSNSDAIEESNRGSTDNSHYYNYFDFFGKWESVFGRDSLHPRLFEKSQFVDGDIRKDFLATVLPEINPELMSFENKSANESLSHDLAHLFRAINSRKDKYIGRFPDPTPSTFKSIISSLEFLDKNTPVYDSRQEEMYDTFNGSNVDFFARYFGQASNLFERPDSSRKKEHRPSTFDISDMASMIEAILSIDNLIVIKKSEINFLRDVALRKLAEGKLSNEEAVSLLKIANRARPKGKQILSTLNELHREK